LKTLEKLLDQRPDQSDSVGSYYSGAVAEGEKGLKRTRSYEITLKKFEVRDAFAQYVSDTIGRNESLSADGFDFILSQFARHAALNLKGYNQLDAAAQKRCIDCINEVKGQFLKAFSDLNTDISLAKLPTLREMNLTFTAMPTTAEGMLECFAAFCADSRFNSILQSSSDPARLAAFKITRLALGVTETEGTSGAMSEMVRQFNLA
jgi:hypothetical protein